MAFTDEFQRTVPPNTARPAPASTTAAGPIGGLKPFISVLIEVPPAGATLESTGNAVRIDVRMAASVFYPDDVGGGASDPVDDVRVRLGDGGFGAALRDPHDPLGWNYSGTISTAGS